MARVGAFLNKAIPNNQGTTKPIRIFIKIRPTPYIVDTIKYDPSFLDLNPLTRNY